ncbi:MAG: RNA methyltransferase [Alphaproteobacteria bacterium]|nr:RNA methyltransferase [Alphaproteobacteria bacterium]
MPDKRPRPADKGSRPPHRGGNRRPNPRHSGPAPKEELSEIRIFGLHPAQAALTNPARKILNAAMTANAARKLDAQLRDREIVPEPTTPRNLDRILGPDTVHQGILLECEPLEEPSIEDLIIAAGEGRPLMVLDQVTDPHNVGAILRSGAVFGCGGLIMTRRHSPPLSGVLAKSASGGLEHVPVHLATNLARAIGELKDAGVITLGLDGGAETEFHDAIPSDRPMAIVLGAEGKGLRQLTAEKCDQLCRIETTGALASLNVSNAAAIALHLAAMKRRGK